ncbi:site-specific integrase [Dysgonomonas sp. 521]|uniref:site-specific integrase n=1 Tax=Dysgonomonas sp. 521 TaxID=2302932 RepID=UPI0013D7117B|nr:site-specific integrase [Dysgonomonas sp. 521]
MKSELKVLFYLKKNRTKENGLCPVMGRITTGKTMAQFSLKLEADARLWDTKAGRMTGKSKAALAVNSRIDKTNLLIHSRYRELKENRGEVTAIQVKNAIQGIASTQDTVLDHFLKMNETMFSRVGIDRSLSSYKHYVKACNALCCFLRKKYNLTDIPFKALTYSFIEEYHFHLRVERKFKPSTAAGYIIFLRKVVRNAVNAGIIGCDPFLGFEADAVTTQHKTLTKEELEIIMTIDLKLNLQIISRDMFIFSAFTGISYVDVRNLTAEKIVTMEDGSRWIMDKRQKTGAAFSVRLMDIPLAIIEKYKGTGSNGKLFPMPCTGTVYFSLNSIARRCGINKKIGYHTARHTNSAFRLKTSKLQEVFS